LSIVGKRINVEAFPFSSQDGEYLTCAETSLWMILHYYGSRYKEYKRALPHEIVELIDSNYYQRVLPSDGLNVTYSSNVLKRFGFSPKIYYRVVENASDTDEINFKRWFYYYVESGIPLMVGIRFKNRSYGHAVVVIGHGKIEYDNIVYENFDGIEVANSADLIKDYVFMDDNKLPYQKFEFDKFGYEDEEKIKYFIVPLYKRIFLSAEEAEKIFYAILRSDWIGPKKYGIDKFIVRIFLTTARNLKEHRINSAKKEKEKELYANIILPKFVWVCEIYDENGYKNGLVSGEIIIDATSSKKSEKFDELIFVRYKGRFGYKSFDENIYNLVAFLVKNQDLLDIQFKAFDKNLRKV
jgi:hypothetical protein